MTDFGKQPAAPAAPPQNPMAAMMGGVAKEMQAASQAASETRHKELMLLLTEIRNLLKDVLES